MRRTTLPANMGMILLAIWLIATGVVQLGVVAIAGLGPLLGVLAVASGVLLLLRR